MKFLNAIIFSTCLALMSTQLARAAEPGGKPEKSDVVVTYAQPSGAFTPIWVAYEAGLFKKYGLNATLQLLERRRYRHRRSSPRRQTFTLTGRI